MFRRSLLASFIFATIHITTTQAVWSCSDDAECSLIGGGVCLDGVCACPIGQQPILGGTVCADVAPYHTSPCVEDHQCSRMTLLFACRRDNETDTVGKCSCQPGHHYFLGRCWPSADFGDPCISSEQCWGSIRNPYSLACEGTCRCAEGFYERQRGECREIGHAVGDGCVVNSDCQFDGGACDVSTLSCFDTNRANNQSRDIPAQNGAVTEMIVDDIDDVVDDDDDDNDDNDDDDNDVEMPASRPHGVACNVSNPCDEPFECSNLGLCWCPVGYYPSSDGSTCFAELGSPSTAEQCVGLLAVVRDGICTCPANFFFEENMRDCIRVTRTISESCVTDANCHTFGAAARCGPAQAPWGVRTCECDLERAVWDAERQMCRLFAGVGEPCEVDSDCLAGELEIQCLVNAGGQGYCTCPDGFVTMDGLCLTLGLELGDTCQVSAECNGTANAVCEDGVCACDSSSYQEVDGVCAAIIGGVCATDDDCVVEDTECHSAGDSLTCQCKSGFVEADDQCWPGLAEQSSSCNVTEQCQALLGTASECANGVCQCSSGHHLRDGGCWPITDLFQPCRRSSECYLPTQSERVVCRNSICQCDFHYPFSEDYSTCTSSAPTLAASIVLILSVFINLLT